MWREGQIDMELPFSGYRGVLHSSHPPACLLVIAKASAWGLALSLSDCPLVGLSSGPPHLLPLCTCLQDPKTTAFRRTSFPVWALKIASAGFVLSWICSCRDW
jgi:hypothetical protein